MGKRDSQARTDADTHGADASADAVTGVDQVGDSAAPDAGSTTDAADPADTTEAAPDPARDSLDDIVESVNEGMPAAIRRPPTISCVVEVMARAAMQAGDYRAHAALNRLYIALAHAREVCAQIREDVKPDAGASRLVAELLESF